MNKKSYKSYQEDFLDKINTWLDTDSIILIYTLKLLSIYERNISED